MVEKKKEKKEQKEKPVTVHITNHNTFQKGVGAFVTNLNHLTIVMDSEGNMKMDASQVPVMPHTEVEIEQSPEEEGQDGEPLTAADMAAACEQTLAEGIAVTFEEQIRLCIFLLMNERILVKKKGKEVEEPLFNLQNHWQAIYRILVDKKYCKDSDFDGFDLFINKVMPSKVNAPYKKSSVKQISQTDFNKPFAKWKFDAETSGTLRPFERMKAIAQRFLELLEEKGL